MQLGGTDLRDDQLFATLTALYGYYILRADLRRLTPVIESLRAGLEQGRQWFRPVVEACFGVLACVRGDFDAASSQLEAAIAGQTGADQHQIEAVWFVPNDPNAAARIYLGWTRLVRGDLAGAEAELAHAERRADQLGFPQGLYSLAHVRLVESWLRNEAGQLDRAAALAADLTEQAERHGLDQLRGTGAAQQAAVSALAALGTDDLDPTALSAHIATMTKFVDSRRTSGINFYSTIYDGVLARLLTAVGKPEQARRRLDIGLQLAQDTGMHFYDAELLRLRARTQTDPDARRADISAALELARRQGATLFELRATLDDFELRGQPVRAALLDVVSRFPADSPLPELGQARALLH